MKSKKKMKTQKIEIMAPVGSYESLSAAIKAGADSVYFGISDLNMRSNSANNFNLDDLKKISLVCKNAEIKSYLTVNTIIYDEDKLLMEKICDAAKSFGIDAIIACDMAVIKYCNKIGMEIHMSTQTNISNIEAVKFYSKFADIIVLARELRLEQIKKICDEIKKENIKGPSGRLVEIEVFVHGALCVSISGKCYMSLAQYDKSANKGKCLQACRRAYRVIDEETGQELRIDNKYIMSPADLCTIRFIPELIDAGISVFKIEGRGRSEDYVYTVIKCYREAVDSYYSKTFNEDKIKEWIKKLESVYNRGFWHGGYYLGKETGEWSGGYGSKAKKERVFLGTVKHYFSKKGVAVLEIESGELNLRDEIQITGKTTGVVEARVLEIWKDDKKTKKAVKGDLITIKVPEKIRDKDRLYIIIDRKHWQGKN